MSFSRSHISMIIKYIGISFITGAISHGFFSGTRQMMTAVAGIGLFIIGTLMEHDTDKNIRNIFLAVGLAIGIGAVTGGLQHFPDSPERSLWILPVGFALSLLFYALVHGYKLSKKEYTYAGISLVSVLCISVGIFALIENTGITQHGHDITSSIDVEAAGIEPTILSGNITPTTTIDNHATSVDHHN